MIPHLRYWYYLFLTYFLLTCKIANKLFFLEVGILYPRSSKSFARLFILKRGLRGTEWVEFFENRRAIKKRSPKKQGLGTEKYSCLLLTSRAFTSESYRWLFSFCTQDSARTQAIVIDIELTKIDYLSIVHKYLSWICRMSKCRKIRQGWPSASICTPIGTPRTQAL